jgi:FkbM family methyltransferase
MNLSLIQKYFIPKAILDIGGHTGEFYNIAKKVFPETYIFIIEGNRDCEPYLKNLGTQYLIRLLGKERGKAVFYKTAADPLCTGNSLYKEITPHFNDHRLIKEETELRTIDDTFQEETQFDLIKIDTQGAELDILEGGPKIAKKAKGIILEVSYTKYNEGAPLYDDVVRYMNNYGFIEKETLDEISCSKEREGFDLLQRDILFINKDIL